MVQCFANATWGYGPQLPWPPIRLPPKPPLIDGCCCCRQGHLILPAPTHRDLAPVSLSSSLHTAFVASRVPPTTQKRSSPCSPCMLKRAPSLEHPRPTAPARTLPPSRPPSDTLHSSARTHLRRSPDPGCAAQPQHLAAEAVVSTGVLIFPLDHKLV